ncbi:MAG: CPBP family intramembrane metalloprotease [Actinobacteria bacterium]|nr:CPBP family intramembrane metalloprotease [Actinomycetota bacterium]
MRLPLDLPLLPGIGLFVLSIGSQLLVNRIIRRISSNRPRFRSYASWLTNLGWIAGPLAAVWIASSRYGSGDPIRDFGFLPRLWDLVLVPATVIVGGTVTTLVGSVVKRLAPTDIPSAPKSIEEAHPLTLPPTVFVAVVAHLTEEISYRGFLQQAFAFAMPVPFAVFIQAVAFGLGHSGILQRKGFLILPTVQSTLIGSSLGGAVALSGRLFPAIASHVILNILALAELKKRVVTDGNLA